MLYLLLFSAATILVSSITYWWQSIALIGFSHQDYRQDCRRRINLLYLVMPIFGGLWMLIIVLAGHDYSQVLILAAASIIILRLIYLDTMTYRLPQKYTLALALLGFYRHDEWQTALVLGSSLIILKIVYEWQSGKRMLGLGDIKLSLALGLWLPIDAIANFYILTGLLGIIWGRVWRIRFNTDYFPFGPPLLLSFTCLYLSKIASSKLSNILSLF